MRQERVEVQREVGHLRPVDHQLELEALAEVAPGTLSGNALARVQQVHRLVDLWDITLCTHEF